MVPLNCGFEWWRRVETDADGWLDGVKTVEWRENQQEVELKKEA